MAYKKTFDEIISYIKDRITEGAWKPCDKLPSERDLSEALGVSRPAVREALRALEIIGLVKSVHGGGNYLTCDLSGCLIEPLSLMFATCGTDIGQVQHLRHALERETAKLAAQSCTDTELENLRSIVYRMADSDSERARADLDRKLHYTIAEYARSPLILSTLFAASSLIEELIKDIRVMIMNDSASGVIDGQHMAIIDAISRGDAYLAVKCMDVHMEMIEQYVLRMGAAR